MTINEKLEKLRKELNKGNLDGYLITGTDYNQSEYVAPYFRTREFISGFTGSAGTVLITPDKALLFVDSRYYIQGAEQIKGSEYVLMKLDFQDTPDPYEYIERNFDRGSRIGVDEKTISIKLFKELEKRFLLKEIKLVGTEDLVDGVISDRPSFPFSPCKDFSEEYAGLKRSEKIDAILKKIYEKGAKATFVSSLDDIAWILNLRGSDVPHSPVFTSFLYICEGETVLFTSLARFDEGLKTELEKDIKLFEMDKVYEYLKGRKGKVYIDDSRVNQSFDSFFPDRITGYDISTLLKARKNEAELAGMRKAHFLDGIAYLNFRAELKKQKDLDEIKVSRLFEIEREKMPGYIEPSFSPISGFAHHGAICHYSATEESSLKIDKDSLLVLDTGSHYEFGTTDLTRTLLFGKASKEHKRDYTLVLKGHLALSSAWFIEGTTGLQLDVLAKQYLWQVGKSYFHGTGHGVGCYLNVHEGPASISTRKIDVPLSEHMIFSDEPGLYVEGEYGIRIENLVAVQKASRTQFGQFYSFETLSMIPYERSLIDMSLLSDIEIKQIDSYHNWIYISFKDFVKGEALTYLREATAPLEK